MSKATKIIILSFAVLITIGSFLLFLNAIENRKPQQTANNTTTTFSFTAPLETFIPQTTTAPTHHDSLTTETPTTTETKSTGETTPEETTSTRTIVVIVDDTSTTSTTTTTTSPTTTKSTTVPPTSTQTTTSHKYKSGKLDVVVNEASISAALGKLELLTVSEPENVSYDRTEWVHWNNLNPSCWNVREELLYLTSMPEEIVLLDKNGQTTTNKGLACSIPYGKWKDPYSNDIITESSKIDIDHLIPLAYAARHGGQAWGKEKKREFANDINSVLVISSARENRSKGDKGPGAWMPPNISYHAEYAIRWINIAYKYDLSVSSADKAVLISAIINNR